MIFLLYTGTSALIIYQYFQHPEDTKILCTHVLGKARPEQKGQPGEVHLLTECQCFTLLTLSERSKQKLIDGLYHDVRALPSLSLLTSILLLDLKSITLVAKDALCEVSHVDDDAHPDVDISVGKGHTAFFC